MVTDVNNELAKWYKKIKKHVKTFSKHNTIKAFTLLFRVDFWGGI